LYARKLRKKGNCLVRWSNEDLSKYTQAKEYIDTILIPLQAFHFSNETSLTNDAFQKDVLSIYMNEIEKELSGRVMLIPPYSYVKSKNLDTEVDRLNQWIEDIKTQPFQNIFAVTFDNAWKKVENNLNCNLLWLPGMKEGDIQAEETVKLIRNQVEQISELIRSYW